MATYAIGDVQGCYQALQTLLTQLRFEPAHDQLWFTGDLVNRGPDSLQVLRLVRNLGTAAITVLGNHDLHLLALSTQQHPTLGAHDTLADILAAPDRDELLHWLRQQPVFHHDVHLGYAMVHAGLAPQWDLARAQTCAHELETVLRDPQAFSTWQSHMYGNKPAIWSDNLRGADRLRFITNCFTRLRVCDAQGALQLKYKGTVHELPDDLYPWFRAPNRRFAADLRTTKLIFGHWSALGFYNADGVIGLDTGCVWGGNLCALRIDQPSEAVQVSCHAHLHPERG